MLGKRQQSWGEAPVLQGDLQPLSSLCSAAHVWSLPGQQHLTKVYLQTVFVFPSKLGVIPP